jgi:hypothetical protein
MKKLLVAAAAAGFALAGSSTFTLAQAASKNPFCSMARFQKNLVGWDEYYGCWNRPAARAGLMNYAPGPSLSRAPINATKSTFCKMTRSEKDPVSWSDYYGCWR